MDEKVRGVQVAVDRIPGSNGNSATPNVERAEKWATLLERVIPSAQQHSTTIEMKEKTPPQHPGRPEVQRSAPGGEITARQTKPIQFRG